MTILVGYPAKRRAKAVLSLAGMLARSSSQDVVICTAVPDPWVPEITPDNPALRTYADELAEAALETARQDMPSDVAVHYATIPARSAASGLIDAAEQYNATMIVVGSAMGLAERIAVSSVADRLLHSSPIPVAVAPRGFRAAAGKVKRVTLAFRGDTHSIVQVAAAETLATHFEADLRLAAFAVDVAATAGIRAHLVAEPILADWRAHLRSAADNAVRSDPASAKRNPELVFGAGDDWEDALDAIDWEPGDVLVIGSSQAGPLSRVFLGSNATTFVRHSPVPVLAIPREAAKELAEE